MRRKKIFITAIAAIVIVVAVIAIVIGVKNGKKKNSTGANGNSPNIADTFPIEAKAVASNPQLATSDGPYAVFHTTAGDITAVLYPEQAPKAVENFTTHAKNGYYDGLLFYWVISGSIIQGGDPKNNGTGGESIWGEDFEDEISDDLHNFYGALAMANSGTDTNGSEFYFVDSNNKSGDIAENMYVKEIMHDGAKEYKQLVADNPDMSDEEKASFKDELTAKVQAVSSEGVPQEYLDKYAKAVELYKEVGGSYGLDYEHTVFGQVIYGMNVVDAISQVSVDENQKPVVDVVIKSIEILDQKPDYVTEN